VIAAIVLNWIGPTIIEVHCRRLEIPVGDGVQIFSIGSKGWIAIRIKTLVALFQAFVFDIIESKLD
jgi:hypothetical protein